MENTDKYNTKIQPTWCPGCGNFGIFKALKDALAELKIEPYELAVVTDVGCSGNMADFIRCYGIHALHGRALPPAAGIKLANQELRVIAVIGDGGCYGEGLNHFVNLMRGNHDITVLVHDNFLYSLTTGQYSPTTPRGTKTKSTPFGSIEEAMSPLSLAVANSASFCARGYALEGEHLKNLIIKGIKHKGFSFIDILQPCVTFNKSQTIEWYKKRVYKLENKFETRVEAFKESQKNDKLGIGVFWEEKKPVYHEQVETLKAGPLVKQGIKEIDIGKLVEEFI